MERMLLDDYVNGRDLFPKEWAEDTRQAIPSPKKIITENDFDFTDAGFANELFRIGGKEMKLNYDTNKSRIKHSTEENDSESGSSNKSIRLYEKAYASYKPEVGESNAESAARHQLIDDRVSELKEARKRLLTLYYPARLGHTFTTSPRLTRTINNKQRREITRRQERMKRRNDHDQKMTAKYKTLLDHLSNPSQTTQMYRHDRCPHCDRPVSTTNINLLVDMTCYECKRRQANWNTPHKVYEILETKHSDSFAKIIFTLTRTPPDHNYGVTPTPQHTSSPMGGRMTSPLRIGLKAGTKTSILGDFNPGPIRYELHIKKCPTLKRRPTRKMTSL
jgi:hypothetical protein